MMGLDKPETFRKVKWGKAHPCTSTEALYRPYGPQGGNVYRVTKYTKNKLCMKLVVFTRLHRDAQSTKHKIFIIITASSISSLETAWLPLYMELGSLPGVTAFGKRH